MLHCAHISFDILATTGPFQYGLWDLLGQHSFVPAHSPGRSDCTPTCILTSSILPMLLYDALFIETRLGHRRQQYKGMRSFIIHTVTNIRVVEYRCH
jgi:hypothetical protein